jgi:hypothetical protein
VAAAVTRMDYYNGASPVFTGASFAGVTAEGGFKFNRDDTLSGVTPIPIPGATGTNFSWLKNLALDVTTVGTTTISNRRIYAGSAPATGIGLFYKSVVIGSYAQAASGNLPAASGSNGATPAGYTAMATSLGGSTAYDASSVASSTLGVNGSLAVIVAGVDNLFVGGPGSATALPTINITFDEA